MMADLRNEYSSSSSIATDISCESPVRRPRQFHIVDSVQLGSLLGTGAFNDVYEVHISPNQCATVDVCFCRSSCSFSSSSVSESEASYTSSSECVLLESSASYVVKHLKESLLEEGDVDAYRTGALDLAAEAEILSGLSHPNVIAFHGILGASRDLLLEKLTCTLTDRVSSWRDEERPYRRGTLTLASPKSCRAKCQELLRSRLGAALDIARGMRYLHSVGVMHRDIKPENIGFAADGTAKIFDFGLATRVDPVTGAGPDGHKHTGLVGTFRYMAPEVAKCLNYDMSVDTYAFGLVLWEICTLDKAYGRISRKDFIGRVVHGTLRPRVPSSWRSALRYLVMSCWDGNPLVRPSFKTAIATITRVMDQMQQPTTLRPPLCWKPQALVATAGRRRGGGRRHSSVADCRASSLSGSKTMSSPSQRRISS